MNQLTDEELRKLMALHLGEKVVESCSLNELQNLCRAVIEAEHKRLFGVGMEPVAAQSKFISATEWVQCFVEHARIVMKAREEWKGYEVRFLYAAETIAAARLQDQQARQQAQIENEALKARIARADAEKASEVLPLKQRIAELEANLKRATAAMAESGYSACDMATAAAQGFRDGMSQSK